MERLQNLTGRGPIRISRLVGVLRITKKAEPRRGSARFIPVYRFEVNPLGCPGQIRGVL